MASPELSRLRKILDDARDAAKRVGDEPQAELEGVDYFADAATSGIISAVDEIAAWDGEITLFIGAGVSMESELPSWNELVHRLLVGAHDSGDGSETVDAWVATVLEEGPLAAAAVAA